MLGDITADTPHISTDTVLYSTDVNDPDSSQIVFDTAPIDGSTIDVKLQPTTFGKRVVTTFDGVDTTDGNMAPQLDALKTLLPAWLLWQSDEDALRFVRQGVPGMTAPQLYLKRKGVWTGGHEENLRFSSVNCCHGPGSSRWFAVDPQHASKVRSLVKEKCQVDIYVDEGNWWPDPSWLRSYGIPVREGLQTPDDARLLAFVRHLHHRLRPRYDAEAHELRAKLHGQSIVR